MFHRQEFLKIKLGEKVKSKEVSCVPETKSKRGKMNLDKDIRQKQVTGNTENKQKGFSNQKL